MFCSVDGCGRSVYAKGFCIAHYFRSRKGDVRPDVPVRSKVVTRLCNIEGCDRKHFAMGMCELHYRRWKRRGEPERLIAPQGLKTCSVKGCDKPSEAKGLCHGHYQRLRRGSALTDDVPLERPECAVRGCTRRATPKTEYCVTHLQRRQKKGDVEPEKPIRVVYGTGSLKDGYRYVSVSKSERHLSGGRDTIQEHRLVMARILGRALTPEESVHHINGDRLDNRPANLELWTRSQPPGQRLADRLAHAHEMLRRYRPDLLAEP